MFKGKTKKSKPAWELRLEQQIKQLNQDYSRMKALNENKAVKRKHVDRLERKYRFNQKGKSTVLETIRQRMIAKEGKLKRYRNGINQYNQNRTFQNNEGRFYQQLNWQIGGKEQEKSNAEEAKRFWSDIWDNPKEHKSDAKWLKDLREELCAIEQQEDVTIDSEGLKASSENWQTGKHLGRMAFMGTGTRDFLHCMLKWLHS